MKKKILSLAAIMMMIMTLPVLTSCGSDDDPVDVDVTPTVTEVKLLIEVTPTADMLKYADLQITYTDDQGADKYANVDSENYKVSVTLTKFPVYGVVKYVCTPKSGVTPGDTDAITVCTGFTVKRVITYSDGSSSTGSITSTSGTVSFYGNKLSDWLSTHETISRSIVNIDKDGNFVQNASNFL